MLSVKGAFNPNKKIFQIMALLFAVATSVESRTSEEIDSLLRTDCNDIVTEAVAATNKSWKGAYYDGKCFILINAMSAKVSKAKSWCTTYTQTPKDGFKTTSWLATLDGKITTASLWKAHVLIPAGYDQQNSYGFLTGCRHHSGPMNLYDSYRWEETEKVCSYTLWESGEPTRGSRYRLGWIDSGRGMQNWHDYSMKFACSRRAKFCANLPRKPLNSHWSPESKPSGIDGYLPYTKVTATCNEGYALDGSGTKEQTVECGNEEWQGQWRSCAPSCHQPHLPERTYIPNAAPTLNGGRYWQGNTIHVQCVTDTVVKYTKSKTQQMITCQSNGQWLPLPLFPCVKGCPRKHPRHGKFKRRGPYHKGEIVTVRCAKGYEHDGKNKFLVTCDGTNWDREINSCEKAVEVSGWFANNLSVIMVVGALMLIICVLLCVGVAAGGYMYHSNTKKKIQRAENRGRHAEQGPGLRPVSPSFWSRLSRHGGRGSRVDRPKVSTHRDRSIWPRFSRRADCARDKTIKEGSRKVLTAKSIQQSQNNVDRINNRSSMTQNDKTQTKYFSERNMNPSPVSRHVWSGFSGQQS